MEEDLKVLEKFINRCKECKFATCEQCEINWTQIKSIENLINRNKELEEKANRLGKLYYEVNENCIKYEKDYIPKSKVRDLQDKYKNKIEKLESKKIWNEPVDTINKNRYTNYFNAYEELLEGENRYMSRFIVYYEIQKGVLESKNISKDEFKSFMQYLRDKNGILVNIQKIQEREDEERN